MVNRLARELWGWHRPGVKRLFTKTQVHAKAQSRCICTDARPVPEG